MKWQMWGKGLFEKSYDNGKKGSIEVLADVLDKANMLDNVVEENLNIIYVEVHNNVAVERNAYINLVKGNNKVMKRVILVEATIKGKANQDIQVYYNFCRNYCYI